MERMIITHSPALQGEVSISGAKNSALPILAASFVGNRRDYFIRCAAIGRCEGNFTGYSKFRGTSQL